MHPFLRRLTHLPSPVRPIVSSSSSFSTFPAPTASAATTATTTNTTNYVGTLLPFDEEPPVNAQKVDTSSLISEQTSINQTMNDLPDLQPASSLTPPDTEISTLPNGVRVVSQETFRQCTTVSALVQVGSRYETNDTTGCTHLIEQMAFKSTTKRSHSEVIGALESIGGVPQAVASREEIVYSVDVLREHSHKAMEILGEVVCSPQILPEELEESRQVIGFLLENSVDQFSGNIQGNVMEELTSVAFGGGSRDEEASDSEEAAKTASPPPLGRPLFHDPLRTGLDGMPAPNIDVVRQFHGDHFCGENVIVSAAGLDHQEAVQLAKQHFGHLPQAPKDPNVTVLREQALVPNDYVGGCRLVDIPNLDYVHVGLGFETGGWHDDDLVPVCVLVALLGGGDSFSAGGPGKGMYSRLYREVLNRCGWVESILGISLIHTDVGCVGIVGSTTAEYAPSLYRTMCDQWIRAATEPVDEESLSRARNRLKSSVLMNLESRLVLGDDMARQVATYGKRESTDVVCARIDSVTSEDLMRVAQRGITNGTPSVVAYGDLTHIPENIHELVVNFIGTAAADAKMV